MINKVQNHKSQQLNNNVNQRIKAGIDFNSVLQNIQRERELKISGHAMDRLKERQIELNEKDIKSLKGAVESIRNKGGKEALILYNNIAFITSIRNNTIITAVDKDNLKENVFTNIDSAMIL